MVQTTGEAPGTNRLELVGTKGRLVAEQGGIPTPEDPSGGGAAKRQGGRETGGPGGGGGGREGGEREVRRRRRFSHYQATLLRGLTPLQPHPAGKSSLIFTKNNVPSDAGLRGEGEVGPPEYVLVDVLPPAIADDTVRAHGDQVVHLPQV